MAEYWHIGATTMRLRRRRVPTLIGEKRILIYTCLASAVAEQPTIRYASDPTSSAAFRPLSSRVQLRAIAEQIERFRVSQRHSDS